MKELASTSAADRAAFFRECAARRGLSSPVVVEKDFWVCWILRLLFELEAPPRLMFKGGTSLSKGYGLIERFSEDVDLAIDRADLGFGGENDPAVISGTKARARAIESLSEVTTAYVSESLLPRIQEATEGDLSGHAYEIDASEPQTILFSYPSALEAEEYGGVTYIKPVVRLELGSRSDQSPVESVEITSYVAEEFPGEFVDPTCLVITLAPARTFWEKATLLHAENHRPDSGKTPQAWDRGSRHAYDLVMMARGGVVDVATEKHLGLLEEVARHKDVFFRTGWANYDLARVGSLRLVPEGTYLEHLRRDYSGMESMFFGPRPSFDEIIDEIKAIEDRINSLGNTAT